MGANTLPPRVRSKVANSIFKIALLLQKKTKVGWVMPDKDQLRVSYIRNITILSVTIL